MSNITEYLIMKEEVEKVITEREIHNFIKKYKLLPMGMIKELQTKLNSINKENRQNGIGVIHLIYIR